MEVILISVLSASYNIPHHHLQETVIKNLDNPDEKCFVLWVEIGGYFKYSALLLSFDIFFKCRYQSQKVFDREFFDHMKDPTIENSTLLKQQPLKYVSGIVKSVYSIISCMLVSVSMYSIPL